MSLVRSVALAALGCLLSTVCSAQALPDAQTGNAWFDAAARTLAQKLAAPPADARARNVILFVGAGMGVSTLTAARILEGQRRGEPGEENLLWFERFAHTALVKTYTVDAQVPDTAGAMTALLSGVKSKVGLLGLDADAVRGDCASMAGNELVSAVELAELGGIATGIVTSGRLTEAGTAAAYATTPDRDWEDDVGLPVSAASDGCEDIARQLVSFQPRVQARHGRTIDGIDVAMGLGRERFVPASGGVASGAGDDDGSAVGRRRDGRHLLDEWQARYPQGQLVSDADALASASRTPLLALFDTMADVPTLEAMTRQAIALLAPDPQGYLLIVVADDIGQGHADGQAAAALDATIALSQAVRTADALTDDADTLILVTADHGHGLTIGGYPARGNAILGKVVSRAGTPPVRAADGLPYTTLGYAGGRGSGQGGAADTDSPPGRVDLAEIDTTASTFRQASLVPLAATEPSGEDVALHAAGPGADRVYGVIEQNVVFHVMQRALQLYELRMPEEGP